MYRNYEDPYQLEEQLTEKEADLLKAISEDLDEEIIISLAEDVQILKDRVNFAWQDDAEMNY